MLGLIIKILAVWNIVVFVLYGYDKRCAVKDRWRIPEKTLMAAAFLMGGVGAYLGMKVFHHKTRHKLFTIGVPLCILANAVMLYLELRLIA